MGLLDIFRRKPEPEVILTDDIPDEPHATHFISDEEMAEYKLRCIDVGKNHERDILVSEHVSLPTIKNSKRNSSVAIIGSSEDAVKCFVIPNLLAVSTAYIVVDPDGRLYHDYHLYLEEKGYTAAILEITDLSDYDEQKYKSFREGKNALFVKYLPDDGQYDKSISEFLEHFVLSLINDRNKEDHVSLFLPEFLKLGRIKNFETMFSMSRPANISFGFNIKSWGEFDSVYPNTGDGTGADNIIRKADTVLYLGCEDDETKDHIAVVNEKLDEISDDECIVLIRGAQAYKDKRIIVEKGIPFRRAAYLVEHAPKKK